MSEKYFNGANWHKTTVQALTLKPRGETDIFPRSTRDMTIHSFDALASPPTHPQPRSPGNRPTSQLGQTQEWSTHADGAPRLLPWRVRGTLQHRNPQKVRGELLRHTTHLCNSLIAHTHAVTEGGRSRSKSIACAMLLSHANERRRIDRPCPTEGLMQIRPHSLAEEGNDATF